MSYRHIERHGSRSKRAEEMEKVPAVRATRRSLRPAQVRLFDCASRDETARGSAQGDNVSINSSFKLKLDVDTP